MILSPTVKVTFISCYKVQWEPPFFKISNQPKRKTSRKGQIILKHLIQQKQDSKWKDTHLQNSVQIFTKMGELSSMVNCLRQKIICNCKVSSHATFSNEFLTSPRHSPHTISKNTYNKNCMYFIHHSFSELRTQKQEMSSLCVISLLKNETMGFFSDIHV